MSVIALRECFNDHMDRLGKITDLISKLNELRLVFTPQLMDNYLNALDDIQQNTLDSQEFSQQELEEIEEYEENYRKNNLAWLMGTEISFVSEQASQVITGKNDRTSIFYGKFVNIAGLASINVKKAEIENEPSLDGWLDDEIDALQEHYSGKINGLNLRLRDINTNLKYIYNCGISVKDETGKYQNKKVISSDYLEKLMPQEKASFIINTLKELYNVSSPRPGEEPTIDYFGSHVTNKIQLELSKIRQEELAPKPF